ncbi:MAG: recombination mediator RecR [Desulfovibrio sp.]|nr:recombination mediator RecR [Desulfovibrio sp.]
MNERLPEPLRVLTEQLGKLPGLGPKSALRVAMTMLKWPESETRRLGESIYRLRDQLCFCERCGGLAAASPCPLCSDLSRGRDELCLVSEWDALLALEDGGFFRGQYMILGGLLMPLQNMDSQSLELDRLSARLAEGEIRELILALGSTLEAENTASFVKQFVGRRFPQVRVTRLAQGIPLGAEIKHMDKETLRQSLKYRQEL